MSKPSDSKTPPVYFDIKNMTGAKIIEFLISKKKAITKTQVAKYCGIYKKISADLTAGKTLLFSDIGENYDVAIRYHNFKYQVKFVGSPNVDVYKCFYKLGSELDKYQQVYYFVDDQLINTVNENKMTWFDTHQISELLDYSKPSYLATYYAKYVKEFKVFDKRTYTSAAGLRIMLNRGRKPFCKKFLEELGLDITAKVQSPEAEILEQIIDYLSEDDVKYKLQYPVGTYKVDMYLPDYKIAIEVDEMNHADRDPSYEKEREEYIRENLTDKILRINPNDPKFRIAKVCGRLATMMIK